MMGFVLFWVFLIFQRGNKTGSSHNGNKHLQLSLQRSSDSEHNATVIRKLMTIENDLNVLSYKIKIISVISAGKKKKHLPNEVLMFEGSISTNK